MKVSQKAKAQAVKKGVLMPNLGVTAEEARSLRAYLRAHQ